MHPFRVCLLPICGIALISSALAQEKEFPGLLKAMGPKAYEEAGLNKLTPEERARLDGFIQQYVAASSEKAATAAVDEAVKTRKVKEPEVIESNIVGPFTGYTGRSRFTLQNGQVWAQSQQVDRIYPKIDSPPVVIVKAGWGHRMYILGGGNIRVSRVK
ncbi:MAG: hypothetical protein ABR589_05540 [Chthoniobacterales bacterium]